LQDGLDVILPELTLSAITALGVFSLIVFSDIQ
jgi:hypothetical protein